MTTDVPRKRGRPTAQTAEVLSTAIVQYALTSFRSVGYEATSMEGIALAAGVSKHTLYRRYPSKDALFIAVVELDRQAALTRLSDMQVCQDAPTMERLRLICEALFDLSVSPGSTDLYRACIGAVPNFPTIGEQFRETERAIQQLIEPIVAKGQQEGLIMPGDATTLSTQLYHIIIGEAWMHALLGRQYVGNAAARAVLFESNWRMFVAAYGTDAARTSRA